MANTRIIRQFLRWLWANGYYIRRRLEDSPFSEGAEDEEELLKRWKEGKKKAPRR